MGSDNEISESRLEDYLRVVRDISIVGVSSSIIVYLTIKHNLYLAYSHARAILSTAINFPPQGMIKTKRAFTNSPREIENLGRVVNSGELYIPAEHVQSSHNRLWFLHLDGVKQGYHARFIDYVPHKVVF